jgi:hypothetical protein
MRSTTEASDDAEKIKDEQEPPQPQGSVMKLFATIVEGNTDVMRLAYSSAIAARRRSNDCTDCPGHDSSSVSPAVRRSIDCTDCPGHDSSSVLHAASSELISTTWDAIGEMAFKEWEGSQCSMLHSSSMGTYEYYHMNERGLLGDDHRPIQQQIVVLETRPAATETGLTHNTLQTTVTSQSSWEHPASHNDVHSVAGQHSTATCLGCNLEMQRPQPSELYVTRAPPSGDVPAVPEFSHITYRANKQGVYRVD